MKRVTCVTVAAALLAAAWLVWSPAGAQGDRVPSVKDVMKRLNGGPSCVGVTIDKDLKAESPNWNAVQNATKEYALLAAAVGKNDPPKGDKASWEKQTKGYAELAATLEAAAQKKDKSAAQTAYVKIVGACKACHNAHRPD
jgi:hypothetical protein